MLGFSSTPNGESQIFKHGQLITTTGPSITEMWYREFSISQHMSDVKGVYYNFMVEPNKQYVRLQKVNVEQPIAEKGRYIFRTVNMGETGLYHLIYIKPKNQTTPLFHLCSISFKNNKADFIHFKMASSIIEYIHVLVVLKQTHMAEPNDDQYEFVEEPTVEFKPIFSETKLKDAVGLFLKFLIIIFNVDKDSILLKKELDKENIATHNFIIGDIDNDIGQTTKYFLGSVGNTALNSVNMNNLVVDLEKDKYVEQNIKDLDTLKNNHTRLIEKYGGKKIKRKKSKNRRTQKSKNRRTQKSKKRQRQKKR